MEENLHPAHRARAAVARLGRLIDETDPVVRMIEERERRQAVEDVRRRRLDAAADTGRWWDDRRTLP